MIEKPIISERSTTRPGRKRAASSVPGGDLGTVLRLMRDRMGATQRDFAPVLSSSQGILSRYESGGALPTAEKLIALLRLAATDEERGPILRALEAHGVAASDLAPALLGATETPESRCTILVTPKMEPRAISGGDSFSDRGVS